MKKTLLTTYCLLLTAFAAFAVNGVASDPSRSLYTARQLGMGGVSVNFSDDGSGVFANPAQLTDFEFPQITTASRKLLLDETQYLFAGWAVPTAYGTFGLGYAGLGVGGSIPTTLDPTTGRITQNPSLEAGSFSNSIFALSYSRKINVPVKLSVGGNLKFFNQAVSGSGGDRGTGLGLDLGINYKPLKWLETGVVLQNLIGGSIKWGTVEDKLGAGYKLGVRAAVSDQINAGLDLDLGSSSLFHLGVEYFPLKDISLRAGLNQEAAGAGLTFGVGMENGGFRYDYAFVQRAGLPGDNPHYFTLSYVGERKLTIAKKLKSKAVAIKFLSPRDRLITDSDTVEVVIETAATRDLSQKRTWTVTSISSTSDAFDITETEPLEKTYLNGQAIEKPGTFEAIEALKEGRNVFQVVGFTKPEEKIPSVAGTVETRVLRITPFADTPLSHWASEPISLTVVLGLVSGYPNNTFKPEKGITRAELVTLLVKSLGLQSEILDAYSASEAFKDVKQKNWAAKYIAYGSSIKYVTGYADGDFKPNKVLNRAEGVAILARYAGLEDLSAGSPFPDLKTDFWANKYIEPAKKAGLLNYLAGKEFKPSEPFSRAEACEVLYRVPDIQKKVDEFWNTGVISAAR
ncbi:hypothetical protein A2625_07835 [candidate division WOR-1 bacterium RIFCSPHIGHO2_01_FULL_53_15]|uniref:SLH domain-containing protein n=1 Tax=candidate division WOR-1 bacterium RIFCSPHIGHO2_01_FULL_53_15 TaxID=1802564 RepID=A0A1F4Q0D8_UNCSA|nr:MAG: hypothetical protein A2625_07835 [candidate division WOR-1 bacterium RIFCSPHIGHO2_01_FULL_53_15]OGC12620.1 MAG: hypothetical protein A3D23_02615 [candidate division WOR-1 bacterium RIFCSPHIGHO2_02_FULL_53_26]